MKIDGACHCGDLTYEAEIDLNQVLVCHCTDCQAMSATAFRVVARSMPDALTLLTGEPSTYSKIGTSGAERVLSFCPMCGTNVFSTRPARDRMSIRSARDRFASVRNSFR
jgi:hypothetical protein